MPKGKYAPPNQPHNKQVDFGWVVGVVKISKSNQKPSVFSCLGLPQDPKGEGIRLESTSEQLQNNFQKGLKTGFLTPNMAKMTPSEG